MKPVNTVGNAYDSDIMHFYGFDYLRALMIIAIVAWHTELFGNLEVLNIARYSAESVRFSTLLCTQFLLLAVPCFFLMSFFLLYRNTQSRKMYGLSRLERLFYLYVFWVSIYIMVRYHAQPDFLPNLFALDYARILSFFAGEGISVYYFNFSLLALTIVAIISKTLKNSYLWICLVCIMGLFLIGPASLMKAETVATADYYKPSLIVYWNPLNFLPYIYVAFLINRYSAMGYEKGPKNRNLTLFVFGLFILLTVLEWLWILYLSPRSHGGYIPAYMRLSVAFGATSLFLASFFIRRPPGVVITFLSRHSLGIYCLHPFTIGLLAGFIGRPQGSFSYSFSVILISTLAAFFVKRAFERRLI